MEAYDSWEHEGLLVEIVHDDDPVSPQENDNAGTLYSWTSEFRGDDQIGQPSGEVLCPVCQGDGEVPTRYTPSAPWTECRKCDGDGYLVVDLRQWFEEHYDAALTIPLRYSNSHGACLYGSSCDEDANCALVFTREDIEREWNGWVVPQGPNNSGAINYARARIKELDDYLQGNVWGIVIRESSDEVEGEGTGLILESCWGFIGEPDAEWIREEANGMAEGVAEGIQREADEAAYWAARDVVTV